MKELTPLFLSILGAGAATLLFLIGGMRALFSKQQRIKIAREKAREKYAKLLLIRAPENPILPQRSFEFEAGGVLNPGAVIDTDGRVHLFYRTIGSDGISRIGYASSADGVHLDEQLPYPIFELPRTPRPLRDMLMRTAYRIAGTTPLASSGVNFVGAEDPRAVIIGDQLFVSFTAFYNPLSLRIGLLRLPLEKLRSRDFTWDALDFLSPENQIHKNWVLFPEKIHGKYAVLHNLHGKDEDIPQIEYTDDLSTLEKTATIESLDPKQLPHRPTAWHKRIRAVGPPPLKTPYGWLVLYHANDANLSQYKLGALLLDLEDPTKILARSPIPILEPKEAYENNGAKEGVVYACGAIIKEDTLMVYYGGSDSFVCLARVPLQSFLEELLKTTENSFLRAPENPIFSPITEHPWEAVAVMNAAAIDIDGTIHIIYRAMGANHVSVLGYASSKDGIHIDERLPNPIYVPRESFEMHHPDARGNSGCEDPRLTRIGDTLYLCYTAYDGVHPPRGAVTTLSVAAFLAHDFSWSTPVLITPEGVSDKDVCLFESNVPGKVNIVHRIEPNICLEQITLDFREPSNTCIELMTPREGMWDSKKIGAAGTPIKINEGWLFIYHGIDNDNIYRLGATLLSPDGTTVTARTESPILEPVDAWEKKGIVPNVVFSCGAVLRDDTLFIYYGAADTVLCAGTLSLAGLMKKLIPTAL